MAKTTEKPAAPDAAGEPPATFRDTLYTSRTLILSDDRTLAVTKARVAVPLSDEVALAYLKANPEFELLEE